MIRIIVLVAIAVGILAVTLAILSLKDGEHRTARQQAGRDREIILNMFAARLPLWMDMWRRGDPNFTPADLAFLRRETIDAGYIVPLDDAYSGDAPERIFRVCSPNQAKCIILDDYLALDKDASGRWRLYNEPDQEVVLIDFAKKERRRLLFFGPTGGAVDDAFWIDNDSCALAGHLPDEDSVASPDPGKFSPCLWIYHLADDTVSLSCGRSSADFDGPEFFKRKYPQIRID
jgi:hypothetical protein